MAKVSRSTGASPAEVFDVLADGWTYASWVVGASRVRAVDPQWPNPGSHVHHSVGVWPLVLDDTTRVVECEPPRRLLLDARGWPFGTARVEILVQADGDGSLVTILEDVSAGPARLVPAPLRRTALVPRNAETLKRLCLLAQGEAPH